MFAVLIQGGRQYRVAEKDRIVVEAVDRREGEQVELTDVLLLSDKGKVSVGSPYVPGASVKAKVLRQLKGPKIDALLFKRRKRSRRRFGHRQRYTELLIEKIDAGAKAAAKKAPREAADKQKPVAKKATRKSGV